jgi:2-polyprenyl-6-methoxyphenol hydroxylase-like FAD-dependent oxidoreductase
MQTITIIGGGLAGLSLGVALRRHDVPVVVKEAGDYPRHRVCGEFISGLRQETVETLGLEDCFTDAAILRDVAWYDNRRKLREDPLPAAAQGLSRWALDQRIVGQLQDLGGVLETGVRQDRKEMQPGWVDCAGRRPARKSPWLGLKCHVRAFRQGADLEMHMSPHGYVGICRIENDCFNLCGLFRNAGLKPDSEQPLIFDYLKQCGFEALLDRIDRQSVVSGSACSVAAMSYQSAGVPEGHTSLGDAHGLIPPFTGNGMTMALEYAALALGPLVQFARSESHWEDCQRQIAAQSRKHFGRRLFVARSLHRLLTSEKLFKLTAGFARSPLFPFQTFYHLTR